MRQLYRNVLVAAFLSAVLSASTTYSLVAEEVESATAAGPSVEELQRKATMIASSYDRMEQLILRMVEIEALTNPQRAALLKRAAQQSSERRTKKQLSDTVALLGPPAKLKRAIDEQERGLADMKSLLELLLSEDRADRLKAEEKRIRDWIKEVDRLIRLEKSVEGRTRGGADPAKLANEQDRIAGRTGDLVDQLREMEEGGAESEENESSDPKPGDQKPGDQKPGDQKPGDQKPGDQKPGDQKPGDQKPGDQKPGEQKSSDQKPGDQKPGDQKPGDQKPGDQKPGDQKPGDQKPGDQKPGESPSGPPQEGEQQGKPGDPSQQQEQEENENPARKRLQAAEQRMREAQKQLEEANRDDAVEEQEKARHELEKAKAELEEILRQLREEEVGRTLALLEGRFRRMLEKQLEIFESTKRLDKIVPDERGRQVDIKQVSKLGFDETKLAVEADKALLLLHEEGSSVAFPEAVEMMRDDMQQVANRLSSTKIGTITQGIEEEIITALEEMIAALQQAQQDLEEKKQQDQKQQTRPQQRGDEPLVDQIAELKMIRALQMRVNTRTTRYSRLIDNGDDLVGQADDDELRESLVKLGDREDRIKEVTKDIVLGKNK